MSTIARITAAARRLRRAPRHVTLVTLSLGAGAAAAFAAACMLFDIFLKPPPGVRYADATRRFYFTYSGAVASTSPSVTSFPLFVQLRDHLQVVGRVEGYSSTDVLMTHEEETVPAHIAIVTGGYFEALGTRAWRGRLLRGEDERPHSLPPLVVSHAFWQSSLAARNDIIGAQVTVDGLTFEVRGVAEPGFRGLDQSAPEDAWAPVTVVDQLFKGQWLDNRAAFWLRAFVRQRGDRASSVPLQAAAVAVIDRWKDDAQPGPSNVQIGPLNEARGPYSPATARTLRWVAAIAGLLFAAALSNVAGLSLSRALSRRRELGIQLSLGASPRRLLGDVALESVLLGLLSFGTASLLLLWIQRGTAIFGAPNARLLTLPRVLLLGVVLSLGVLLSLLGPALLVLRAAYARRHEVTRFAPPHVRATRSAVLATQAGLAVLLLTAAVAFGQAFLRAARIDLGMDADRVVAVSLDSRLFSSSTAQRAALLRDVREMLRRHPAVDGATVVSRAPFSSRELVAASVPGGAEQMTLSYAVDEGFFAVLRTPLLEGRAFSATELGGGRVAIVNRALAERLAPYGSIIGTCLSYSSAMDRQCVPVVGVVATAKYATLQEEPAPAMFLPISWEDRSDARALLVRRRSSVPEISRVVRSAFAAHQVSPDAVRITEVLEPLERQFRPLRLTTALFATLALLALSFACIGVYGVVALIVADARQDLSVRLVLGASRRNVLWHVSGSTLRGAVLGTTVGGGIALLAGRLMTDLLPSGAGVSLSVISIPVALTLLTCVVAGLLAARAGLAIAPVEALRSV
jgi:predicted permease